MPGHLQRFSVWDLGVLLVYLVFTVALGVWVGRRSRDPDRFMVAGRRVPSWAVGMSIFGTFLSSITFIALPGKAYASGWVAFTFSLSIPVAAWVATRWFVPFYRHQGHISAYTHLEARFGPWARTYAVICFLFTQLFRIGTILYLVALAVQPLLGWPIWGLILLVSGAVLVYAVLGGMESVIWTDVMQSFVLIGGALLCAGILTFGFPGGVTDLIQLAAKDGKWSLGSFALDFRHETFLVVLLYGIFINLQNFGVDQNYIQRYHTAATLRQAQSSVWIGGLLYLPISAFFLFIGTALYVWFHYHPDFTAFAPQFDAKPDKAFPFFIATALPNGIAGLLVAAILAAAQSTISSSVNSCATLFFCDIWPGDRKIAGSERFQLRILRVATVVVAVIGTGIAFWMTRAQKALDVWWTGASILSGGVLGLFLTGLLIRRVRPQAAAIGVIVGVGLIGWIALSATDLWPSKWAHWRAPFHSYLAIVIGTLAILMVSVLGAQFSSPNFPPSSSRN